jgi:hypothetical protein
VTGDFFRTCVRSAGACDVQGEVTQGGCRAVARMSLRPLPRKSVRVLSDNLCASLPRDQPEDVQAGLPLLLLLRGADR